MRWNLGKQGDRESARRLSRTVGLPLFLCDLLVRRGFGTVELAEAFLNPKLKTLIDPFRMPNMASAVERIFQALGGGERIVLYGDYDVDGVTSLALLTRMLRAYGGMPEPFLPTRAEEGYGLSPEGLGRCLDSLHPRLLITVDCGTTSIKEIARLRLSGVDVLVFDHHERGERLPDCPVVNPKLGDEGHSICSGGLIFKLCHAMLKRRPLGGFNLREHLDLVALATVADLVPLEGENRLLVRKGLQQLEQTRWVGLRALMEVASVRAPICPSDVAFRLGPRLNAAGRLGTAQAALDLLLTDDPARARLLADRLNAQNSDRQYVERQTCEEAERMLLKTFDPERDAAVVVGSAGWHPGVVGIVASRLSRAHCRPAIVVSFDDEGIGKGSGRSIRGYSLVKALWSCRKRLEKFGGHEMAAGLTVRQDQFEAFRNAFLQHARESLGDDDLVPCIDLDCEVALGDLTFQLLHYHEQLQPFGIGNLQPLFFAREVTVISEPRVMKGKHLRLILAQDGSHAEAIYFNGALDPLPRPPWDVAFRIERNEFRGNVRLQIQIQAIRSSGS
jgi:single-stranded-DNA-specific exonuclease